MGEEEEGEEVERQTCGGGDVSVRAVPSCRACVRACVRLCSAQPPAAAAGGFDRQRAMGRRRRRAGGGGDPRVFATARSRGAGREGAGGGEGGGGGRGGHAPIWFSTNQRARCFQVPSSLRFSRRTRTALLPDVCMYSGPFMLGVLGPALSCDRAAGFAATAAGKGSQRTRESPIASSLGGGAGGRAGGRAMQSERGRTAVSFVGAAASCPESEPADFVRGREGRRREKGGGGGVGVRLRQLRRVLGGGRGIGDWWARSLRCAAESQAVALAGGCCLCPLQVPRYPLPARRYLAGTRPGQEGPGRATAGAPRRRPRHRVPHRCPLPASAVSVQSTGAPEEGTKVARLPGSRQLRCTVLLCAARPWPCRPGLPALPAHAQPRPPRPRSAATCLSPRAPTAWQPAARPRTG